MTPMLLYVTYGFPPASKSGTYRQRAVANEFRRRGWDVTVVGPQLSSYEWENGLDWSLVEGCERGIRFVEVDARREDLNPDIRSWPFSRVWNHAQWRREHVDNTQASFPEAYFGGWLSSYLKAARSEVVKRRPNLVMVSPSPYVLLGVALQLHKEFSLPYVIDYRDGWSLNTATGAVQFSEDSPAGLVEKQAFQYAARAWFVNGEILSFYAERFGHAYKYRVVRNGFDPGDLLSIDLSRGINAPLTFGYVGNLLLSRDQLRSVMRGWKRARRASGLVSDAVLKLYGHLGTGSARGTDIRSRVVDRHAEHGVQYYGPLSRRDLVAAYESFDSLVFMHHGHSFATSGKVFEYMGAALPIVAAAPADHGAQEVLADYPLTVGPPSLDPDTLAGYFVSAADRAIGLKAGERSQAVAYAQAFERQRQLQPHVDELDELFGG